jgi:AcrR family transcriptional regulator
VATIKIPKKKPPNAEVKEKRKAGTRADLTRPAIVEAAAKLIESAGVNGFSLRKLAKALGVGPTTIHFHFKRAKGGIYAAIVVQALAGVTRPIKPKEEPSALPRRIALQNPAGAARSTGDRQVCRS